MLFQKAFPTSFFHQEKSATDPTSLLQAHLYAQPIPYKNLYPARPGDFYGREDFEVAQSIIYGTMAFSQVSYRLEPDGNDGYRLVFKCEKRPQNSIGIGLRMDDEQRFARRYGIRHLDVGLGYLVQHWLPVGISVRPGELYKSLWFPFGGHSPFFHAGKVTHK